MAVCPLQDREEKAAAEAYRLRNGYKGVEKSSTGADRPTLAN
jgi:hypothetical protein